VWVSSSEPITSWSTRAIDNAQRVVGSRQELVRFVDYQIDYDNGTLLLKQLAGDDRRGEIRCTSSPPSRRTAAAAAARCGARAPRPTGLATRVRRSTRCASALWAVEDAQSTGSQHLAGVDFRAAWRGWLDVGGEPTRSQNPDSTGVAAARAWRACPVTR
jgi:hypothetical protein